MIEDSVKQLLEVEDQMDLRRQKAEAEVLSLKEEARVQRRLQRKKIKEAIVDYRESLLKEQQEQISQINREFEKELNETHIGYEQMYLANKEEAVTYIVEKVRTDSGR